ncbi:hypothetical protein MNBD_ACTINO01-2637, partial [hydrothermal vent metagenome]
MRSVSNEPGGWGAQGCVGVPWVFTPLARRLACGRVFAVPGSQ